jgi:heme exporter protein A
MTIRPRFPSITRLTVEDVAVQRGERLLFEALGLSVAAGEAVALVGANGAGKTSLLRVVAGLLRPLAGKVSFCGEAAELDADEARRFGCHLVGHQDGLKGVRSAREELEFQAGWAGGDTGAAAAAADRLGLGRLMALPVRVLSAGQRRRLALARLIAAPRSLWLLDEPLAPLDAASRTLFGEIMTEHVDGGGLILAAVHDPLPLDARIVELAA